MNLNSIVAWIAAACLLFGGIVRFREGESGMGMVCLIGALAFILGGIHWHRQARRRSRSK